MKGRQVPPRKAENVPSTTPTADSAPAKVSAKGDAAPGKLWLDVRVGQAGMMVGKTVLSQRVHSYHIDQQGDRVVITGVLRQEQP